MCLGNAFLAEQINNVNLFRNVRKSILIPSPAKDKYNSTYLPINDIDRKFNTMTTLICQMKTRNSSIISKNEIITKSLCFFSVIFTHMQNSKHHISNT